jgi:hypothetical protein
MERPRELDRRLKMRTKLATCVVIFDVRRDEADRGLKRWIS